MIGMKLSNTFFSIARWPKFYGVQSTLHLILLLRVLSARYLERGFNGIESEIARHIRVGVCALLWAVWNCRNDMVFNRTTNFHFLQVIFRVTALIHMWSLLIQTEAKERLVTGSTRWEMVARAIFNRFGWRSCNRIDM